MTPRGTAISETTSLRLKSMPEHPHTVFECCTLVHPDNAVALSYASDCARARFVGCRMIVLNFTQPEMRG